MFVKGTPDPPQMYGYLGGEDTTYMAAHVTISVSIIIEQAVHKLIN